MVTKVGNDSANTLTGTSSADTLDGRGGNDTLYGYAGIDTLLGGSGNDLIYTGNDSDTARGGTGADRIYGENGNDKLYGEDGNDRLYGGYGGDTLVGGNHDDYLDGGPAGDLLQGGSGIDTLYGGTGTDTLQGGTGNDFLDPGTGGNFTYGEDGNDTIYMSDSAGDGLIDYVNGGAGYDTLSFARFTHSVQASLWYSEVFVNEVESYSIEKFVGSNYADNIYSEGVVDAYGGGGNDTIYGYGKLHGGSGNDLVGVYAGSAWGDSGSDDFYLYAYDWSPKATIEDFVVGVDDLIIDIDGTNGNVVDPATGDIYTVQYTDFWGSPVSWQFELDGVTDISAADYVFV